MNVLLTGGAGYIGTHTCIELINAGHTVVVADNFSNSSPKAIERVEEITGKKIPLYNIDVCDVEALDKLFAENKIDAVIHFAANSLVGESMTNPLKYYDNNLNGTKVLLQSLVAHNIDKVVFSSTAATYGEPERTPILETDPTNPTNCYGETKKSMERMFYWVEKAHNLHYVSLRFS